MQRRPLVVFVDAEYQAARKRRRPASSACGDCRRKKKRCEHNKPAESDENVYPRTLSSSALSKGRLPHPRLRDSDPPSAEHVKPTQQDHTLAQVSHSRDNDIDSGAKDTQVDETEVLSSSEEAPREAYARFIGYLNPEVELLTSADGASTDTIGNNEGLWHVDQNDIATASHKSSPTESFSSPASLFHHCTPVTRKLLEPVVKEQCLDVRPPADCLRAMEVFYFENVHPVLPLVEETTYHSSACKGPDRILQSQALCLAVHTNPILEDSLRLIGHDSAFTPADFGRRVLAAMRMSIELALTFDKAILIRMLCTMSLFGYTREASELSCQFFARAVHLLFTLGLHHQSARNRNSHRLDGLFCYVWSVDRLHAAMQGRPVIIHGHDMSVTPIQRSNEQSPGHRVFIRIATLLDQVIALYRPNCVVPKIPAAEFPCYEDILAHCGALELPSRVTETLELLYHAVAILSCRTLPDALKVLPFTQHPRQSFSALEITNILNNDIMGELIILPWVSYAVSLSLSTTYRQVRYSKVLKHRQRAWEMVEKNYNQLRKLKDFSWSASLMAELARKALLGSEDLSPGLDLDVTVTKQKHVAAADLGIGAQAAAATSLDVEGQIIAEEYHGLRREFQDQLDADVGDMWNIGELLEGNLDLGVPNFFQDCSLEQLETFWGLEGQTPAYSFPPA